MIKSLGSLLETKNNKKIKTSKVNVRDDMNVEFFIFFVIATGLLIFDLTTGRAFLLGPYFFPKKEDYPIIYWGSISIKLAVAIACLFYTFTVQNQ